MLTIEGFKTEDVVKLLGEDDADWFFRGCPIPFNSTVDAWERRKEVTEAIGAAESQGVLTREEQHNDFVLPRVMVMSDCMDGTLNPADGKMYDSKSEYYKAVKSKGLEIVGNETIKPAKQPEMDWRPAVAEAINQLS